VPWPPVPPATPPNRRPPPAGLIGELLLKSPEFARLWERYDVTRRTVPSSKTFRHPQVGTITLGFQGMQLEGTPGQRLGIYLADPGTPDYDAMVLLDLTAPRLDGQPARQEH
jgi:MmyB-like transcription regulator ligand binding domain